MGQYSDMPDLDLRWRSCPKDQQMIDVYWGDEVWGPLTPEEWAVLVAAAIISRDSCNGATSAVLTPAPDPLVQSERLRLMYNLCSAQAQVLGLS